MIGNTESRNQMKRIDFNQDWLFKNEKTGKCMSIDLPHDAMIYEERKEENPGKGNSAWFSGGIYKYSKEFWVNEDEGDQTIFIEFEGVYGETEVLINGTKIKDHVNGYTPIELELTEFIILGAMNTVIVKVNNDSLPNSRWYSGSGIYRPVYLVKKPKKYILPHGIKIKTLEIEPKIIEIEVKASHNGEVKLEFFTMDGTCLQEGVKVGLHEEDGYFYLRKEIELQQAQLWKLENPNLYFCKVTYENDFEQVRFGIRKIELALEKGLLLNHERVILRGACIHHDNGLLGACAYAKAEERKVRLLKKSGYNAIRSAHNPCSEALLDACDSLGMLVMDEYTDMWYIHKTQHDYANYVMKEWKKDLKAMVDKDINHPSVIIYSTGNEVAETSEKRGIEFVEEMTEYLHQLDSSRPVTCGVNIFFNYLYSMGFGVYSDEKAKKQKEQKPVGSEFYNKLAGRLGDQFMKRGATLRGSDRKTKEAFAKMDIAGYNYGILRYEKDLKKYPQRFILGTETFCKDAGYFWDLAKKHPRILGDFVWAGMDYMGEVGVGAWEYNDYVPNFDYGPGWISAGSGRIDLVGNTHGETEYTKVAFELNQSPVIAVRPIHKQKNHSPSAWKMTNARNSWTWEGYEGEKTVVEVYARGYYVALSINGRHIAKKRIGKNHVTFFKAIYEPGVIEALVYDKEERLIGRSDLKTANPKTILRLKAEELSIVEGDIVYVAIDYVDEEGSLKPTVRGNIQIEVEGGKLLALGNACSYQLTGYHTKQTDTYYGQAMAILGADQTGKMCIYASDGIRKAQTSIHVISRQPNNQLRQDLQK